MMKKSTPYLKAFLVLCAIILPSTQLDAQFLKKLGKAAERAAERTVERRVEKETTEKTDQALDSILEPGSKSETESPLPTGEGPTVSDAENSSTTQPSSQSTTPESSGPKSLSVYSKFDFVPGDEILFFDDFSDEFVGDFPSKWNTNGSGQIVSFDDGSGNWFEMVGGRKTYHIAGINNLPENYTIEFDVETKGVDKKTSSNAYLVVIVDEKDNFGYGKNTAYAYLPLCQYVERDIRMWNNVEGINVIDNYIGADIRNEFINRPHIAIAINKERYRLYVNENKHVDIPKFVSGSSALNSIKFQLIGVDDGKDRVFINNVKVAEGGIDLRRTLIRDGKVSTNAILFDSGSSKIQPSSMGVIRQIYQVLQQDDAMKLKIVGHTDADGQEASNLKLSKDRAEAVKNTLTSIYTIDKNRLSTEGKGESEPVANSNSTNSKAQNRRVEFIKM